MNRLLGSGMILCLMHLDSGAGGQGGTSPEEVLLKKVQDKIKEELNARSYQNGEQITASINKALEGLNTEQLRAYSDNDKKIKDDLAKVSSDLEKINQRAASIANGAKFDHLKDTLAKRMGEIEKSFNSTGGNSNFFLNIRAAEIMTTLNTVDDTEVPEDLIDSFSVSSFVPKRRSREYVFDVADRTTVAEITKYKTWLEEGDEEGAFAIVAEGALKPLVSLALVRNVSEARKVAGKYVVTEEFVKFRKEAYAIIRRLINDKLIRDYQSILTTELVTDAAPYVGSALDGQYTNPTDYHAIAAVAAQIESLDFLPDVLIMNPQDKWRIGMSQDTNGQFYLTIPMTSPSGETRMMGFLVRTSNRVAVGNFILGEGGLWKVEDEAITIRTGYGIEVTNPTGTAVTAVSSDLDHNRFRVIVELFFHSYIASNHEGSFVYGNFETIKALLEVEEVVEG